MNKDKANKLFNELESLLKEFGNKNNCNITLSSRKYDNVGIYGKVEIKLSDINGIDTEKIEFENNCFFYGLNKEDYKKRVRISNKEFEIVGFDNKARTNCIKIKDIYTDKMYKTTIETIRKVMSV